METTPTSLAIRKRVKTPIPKFKDQPKDIQEKFAKYATPAHEVTLGRYVGYDEDLLRLALWTYPELEDIDWHTADPKWIFDTWTDRLADLRVLSWFNAEAEVDWGQPFREIVRLPKAEFAKRVLKKAVDNEHLHRWYNLEQLEVWAGYRKPEVTKVGNVHYLGKL